MSEKAEYFAQRRPGWQLPKLDKEGLLVDSFEPLEQAAKRQACPQCGKSRALFCYNCLIPFTSIPGIQLPFQLHIITHAAEAPTRATGIHAAVLCPGKVHLQSLDALPQLDPSKSVVMFPSDDAVLPDQVAVHTLDHVIIIDSKWRKAKELNEHPALAGMKRVKLPGNPRSSFWRYHTEGVTDEGVCTIEALHLLLTALADQLPQPKSYWDNLLWYYSYQHSVVEKASAERAAKRALVEFQGGYVKQKKKREKQQQEQQQQHGEQQCDGQQQQQQHCQQQHNQQQQQHQGGHQCNGQQQQHSQQQHRHLQERQQLKDQQHHAVQMQQVGQQHQAAGVSEHCSIDSRQQQTAPQQSACQQQHEQQHEHKQQQQLKQAEDDQHTLGACSADVTPCGQAECSSHSQQLTATAASVGMGQDGG